MQKQFIGLVLLAGLGSSAAAEDLPPFPTHVPPIVGTAVVTDAGQGGEVTEWRIRLTVPKIRWSIVGEVVPKKEWPQLKAEVEKFSLILKMGGPSQLAESRVVDMNGRELSRAEVLRRLSNETPVLVSVSGEMPDAYFLQLISAETLIVLPGPRDGSPAPELLPARQEAAAD